ncbi:MAG: D-glycero-beta-D-manno-heptose 1-phosphate adenylyltransferase [Candidatus Magasanikbacteria bacterium CG10_big_fil_rev_8_21_14_0_10_47_10]|uniref:D-glycero-beta-D-manno-heptose 1-phosphate adenylyltransferase n=1 Tax=Candidatus Magasanikbacteria bacterium CG10_big_fil_rev_8_21_14_0_10_47_10 TaxID=1974652 RepID=A0A2H0TPW4_9BACT|nr:MAG: D-glycero-beta-D-manno-heptose 1-phosphate adenylyltransferase [Candidatus Magasanikbacteria bacterium CG10_big_fil_rev_8_21_14_0_10_47_10]
MNHTMNSEQKIVYTYGVFDMLHSGHVELLKEARALGDKLVVGIFTDEVAEEFKRRPIISQEQRLYVVEHLSCVDEVMIQDQLTPCKNIRLVKPHILAKGPGAGWGEGEETPGAGAIAEVGGVIVKLGYHDGISTSQIIKKIQDLK